MRYDDIATHIGHDIECVEYLDNEGETAVVVIECEDCGEILVSAEQP